MRITNGLAALLLTMALAACSGIETRPAETNAFAAAHYQYYKWRSEPLKTGDRSKDPAYLMDPIVRREVDKGLAARGYVLDIERAQFSVDYIYASGMRMGERSGEISNATPYPSVNPNRGVDQAMVDNAYALGGIKETTNIALQFNDVNSKRQVWQVFITSIVENVNQVDVAELNKRVQKGIHQALRTLPEAQ